MEETLQMQNMEISDNILVYTYYSILKTGKFHGSIITKLNDSANSIIFSDNIIVNESSVKINGLKVGVKGKKAFSNQGSFELDPKTEITFAVKMDEEIVEMFDSARFSGSNYPYMISFLNTSLLYNKSHVNPVNHLDFVAGEILNHPIGLLYNNSIIVGDRLVIDNQGYPIFYDAFLIVTSATGNNSPMDFSYEPLRRININFIKYLILLGSEMLK